MNFGEIKQMVLFQTNNDVDDLGDFLPYLASYINSGYDKLVVAYSGEHSTAESENYPPLTNDRATPNLPEWAHQAIADWATWMIYRNGSLGKQNRGLQYREAFVETESRLHGMTAAEKGLTRSGVRQYIHNIPR